MFVGKDGPAARTEVEPSGLVEWAGRGPLRFCHWSTIGLVEPGLPLLGLGP